MRKQNTIKSALGNTFVFLGVLLLLLTILQLTGTIITIGGESSTNDNFSIPSSSSSISSSSSSSSSSSISSSSNQLQQFNVNLDNSASGISLTTATVIEFLNSGIGTAIFQSAETSANLYKDNGGLRFGSSSSLGELKITTTRQFSRITINARNYGTYNTSTEQWSCDESSISINDSEFIVLRTNTEDKSLQPPLETLNFDFNSTNKINIKTAGKRLTIFSIILWGV